MEMRYWANDLCAVYTFFKLYCYTRILRFVVRLYYVLQQSALTAEFKFIRVYYFFFYIFSFILVNDKIKV